MSHAITDENERLKALRQLDILDSGTEAEFDTLARAAAEAMERPIALISLVDADRVWFKANLGFGDAREAPRDAAFCEHAIRQPGLFEVADARADARFRDNPFVRSDDGIRFYAGVPLTLSDGATVGTLCVIDRQPGRLTDAQRQILTLLGLAVTHALEGRRAKVALSRSEAALRAERTRLIYTLEGTRAGTWEWNVQTGETRFNERWAQFIGYTLDELAPVSIETWLGNAHPDDLGRSGELLNRHFTGEADFYECEARMRHRDGHWIWVLDRGRVVTWTDDGKPEWMFGTHIDITERKLREQALRASEERLGRVSEIAGVGGWELDCETGALTWSDETHRIHGLPKGRFPPLEEALDFYEPEARPVIAAAVERCRTEGIGYDLELPFRQADGRRIWVRAVGNAVHENGRISRLIGAFQDITESRRLRTNLAHEHELLRVTLASIGDGVITTDPRGRIEWLNPVAERLTGWTSAGARGLPLPEVFCVVDEETRAPAPDPVEACLRDHVTVALPEQSVLISRHGKEYGIEDSAAPIRADDGSTLGAVLVFHDVTEQRHLAREMTHRATHDALTGLCNRTEFESRLERMVPDTRDKGTEHALLFIDLDEFKIVNDSCGHTEGDRLLQQIAALIREQLRRSDLVARLGGDEFGIILDNCDLQRARGIAETVCACIDAFRFVHGERSFHVGCSVGLVAIDGRWDSGASVMQAADAACMAAKESGRNRVHVWAESDDAMRARRGEMQWATRIEHALEHDCFALYAQRIVPLRPARHEGISAEVLLRLRDEDGSIIPPSAFMPAAERFHMAPRIDRHVLEKAVYWLAGYPHRDRVSMLSVNLSGRSICDRRFRNFAEALFEFVDPDVARRICLEITETTALGNLSTAADFVEDVRRLGVRVALDDFGSGTATVGYLKAIPIDILKIAGEFVRRLTDDPLDAAAVRGFAEVARVMGVTTIAESVERPQEVEALREIGIDCIQGFIEHRPEPLEALFATQAGRIPDAA